MFAVSYLFVAIIFPVLGNGVQKDNSQNGPFYPGTKWCGPGNSAADEQDYGTEIYTDKCCQKHDECEEFIAPGETFNGLENNSKIYIMHCKCDRKLMNCLYRNMKDGRDVLSSAGVGELFFNLLAPVKCFRKEHPVVGCNEYFNIGIVNICIDYVYDKTSKKKWQFFDDPFFTKPGDDYWSF